MSVISALSPGVRTYLHDFNARARRLALLRAVGLGLSVFAVWMLICCVIDRVAHFESIVRVGLLASGIVAVVGILWRPVRAGVRRNIDWVDVADRVEQRDPQFSQRLVTVASRVLGPAEHRGSDDMLRELLRDVDRQTAAQDPSKLLPLGRIATPWIVLAVTGLVFAGLVRVPGLQINVLAARFLMPLADILPATTTRLHVSSGSRDVVQSQSLRIEASVGSSSAGIVSLFVSEDGGEQWSRSTMDPTRTGASQFAFTLTSVDRDLHYYVTAGDARSRTYAVRVRRPPAVERFAVRYEYPQYTGRSTLTVVSTDGLIEAPVGTTAWLTVTATEPLDYALLTVGGKKILMEPVSDGKPAPGIDDNRQRRAALTVKRDEPYSLDLISDRQVPGEGPAGTMRIQSIPDGKPLVRLPQAGESLRLHPREILPLHYQVLDDYGIAKLALTAQINSSTPVELPVELQGDARRQEREYELDLATMSLAIGDVVTLVLSASDRAGQRAGSEPLAVLVSPRSVDLTTYQRVAEINGAAALAASLHEQLTHAAAALEEADREAATLSLAYRAALNRANRQLTDASESAALIRQALLRVIVSSRSSDLSNAAMEWIDQAQVQSWLAEDLFRRTDVPAGMGNEPRALLARSLESTRVLRDELRSVAAGERAAAVAADRENLLASQKRAATTQPAEVKQRLEQSLARAQEDIAAGAKEIGLDPAAADLDAQLKSRVEAATSLLRGKQMIDFAALAREWSQSLERDRTQPVALDERLSAVAQAEAVRHDADLIRARDLQLAAQAAARIESLAQVTPAIQAISAGVFNDYATALAAVQREHEVNRKPVASRTPEELALARRTAEQGRAVLERWAAEPLPRAAWRAGFDMLSHNAEAEELALRASAEMASRNYAAAAALDAALARHLAEPGGASTGPTTVVASTTPATTTATTAPALATAPATAPATTTATQPYSAATTTTATTVPLIASASTLPDVGPRGMVISQTVRRAETIDRIGTDQQKIAEDTLSAQAQQAPQLAGRQRAVAELIGRVNGQPTPDSAGTDDDALAADPNRRGRATAAVLAAQETLAAMPQQLAAAQEALPVWRQAVARVEQAKRDAAAMPEGEQRQPAALRAAEQAGRDAADAGERFQQRRHPVSPTAARQLAASLEPFAPETAAAADVLAVGLAPAFQKLEDAATAGDAAAVARAADEARQSIEAAQKELSLAQEALTERDPLIAAKWFARAAADSLSLSPPDLRSAQVRQRDTTAALSRAWDRAIHDAASLRMAQLPAMQSVYSPLLPEPLPNTPQTSADRAVAAKSTVDVPAGVASARDWNRLRPREPEDVSGALRDTDPPGFEEPLRLYFELLGKSGAESPPPAAPK